MEHDNDCDINYNQSPRNNLKEPGKDTDGTKDLRKNWNPPDC